MNIFISILICYLVSVIVIGGFDSQQNPFITMLIIIFVFGRVRQWKFARIESNQTAENDTPRKRKRKPIPNWMRQQVFRRDNYQCRICKREAPGVKLEADHIIPDAAGGLTTLENLQTLCLACNRWKSDKIITKRGRN